MSKIDEKYINSLDDFTKALEKVVETLKEQQATNKSDVVNEFLKSVPDNLNLVVEELKSVKEGFAEIKESNKEILKKIESIKKEREAGAFDKIEDPKNKNKIVDGIKIVILIAAGVLALGMAFKIIGKVDFLSVVALSGAIYAMSAAFAKVAEIKNLTLGKVLTIGLILPIMSFSLLVSGYMLKSFPKFSLMQGLSLVLVSGALGIATYLLMTALNKMSLKSIVLLPLIPFMLPLIAQGLVKSSYILKGVQQLSLMQVFSIAMVGLALGIATFGISFALKGLKDVTWKEMLMLPLMIPLIAGGVVLASIIFQAFVPIKNDPNQVLNGSAVIGLSLLTFAPAVYILGKMKIEDLLLGSIAILPMAWVITKASSIFQGFIPLKNPLQIGNSSLAMGLAILFFTSAVWLLGKMSLKQILLGTLGIIPVSLSILAVSWIFSLLPDKMKYPPFLWTLGTGLAVTLFGAAAVIIGLVASEPFFWIGLGSVLAISLAIVATSYILGLGKYTDYPSMKWTLGVGLAIGAFALAATVVGAIALTGVGAVAMLAGVATILVLATSMLAIDKILSAGSFKNYPSKEWAEGVQKSMTLFSGLNDGGEKKGLLSKVVGGFVKGVAGAAIGATMIPLAAAMVAVDKILNTGQFTKYPDSKWTNEASYFIVSISDIVSKHKFDNKKSMEFSLSAKSIGDGINQFVDMFSKINFQNYPTQEYSDNFGYYVLTISKAVNNWKPSEDESKKFSISITYVEQAVRKLSTLPVINAGYVTSMAFLKDGTLQIIKLVSETKDFEINDFKNFNESITLIASAMQILSTLKPLPGGGDLVKAYVQALNHLKDLPEVSGFETKADAIKKLADSFASLAISINSVNTSLESFASLFDRINPNQFGTVLKPVEKYSAKLEVVNKTPESQLNLLNIGYPDVTQSPVEVEKEESVTLFDKDKKKQLEEQKKFYNDIADIKSLLYQFRDYMNQPSQSGSFNK